MNDENFDKVLEICEKYGKGVAGYFYKYQRDNTDECKIAALINEGTKEIKEQQRQELKKYKR